MFNYLPLIDKLDIDLIYIKLSPFSRQIGHRFNLLLNYLPLVDKLGIDLIYVKLSPFSTQIGHLKNHGPNARQIMNSIRPTVYFRHLVYLVPVQNSKLIVRN